MDEFLKVLKRAIVTITFTKKNGESRTMNCTLNRSVIPLELYPSGKIIISEETKNKTLRVFDIDLNEWRSFIIDSVTHTDIKSYISTVELDTETGDYIIQLPDALLDILQWGAGDDLKWESEGDKIILTKV